MELENQVCSLELAKKLKALGVKQSAYWSWVTRKAREYSGEEDRSSLLETDRAYNFEKEKMRWGAFTVAELGEMLPLTLKGKEFYSVNLHTWKTKTGWTVAYHSGDKKLYIREADKTEANVRAKVLIYLIENKLVKK